MSDEPEIQHIHDCPHPQAPCICLRSHLLREGMRIREMYLDILYERDALKRIVDADRRVSEQLDLDDVAMDDPRVREAWSAYTAAHRAYDGYEIERTPEGAT